MPQNNRLSAYLFHGALAALCAGFIGGALFGAVSYAKFGNLAFAYAAVASGTIFMVMGLVILPLMLLRSYIKEPYYFITLSVLGFFGSLFIVNLIIGNNPLSAEAWQPWIVVSFGVTGTVCILIAWSYLHFSETKWLHTY